MARAAPQTSPYRTLTPQKIVETLEQLLLRIQERFPDAGLGRVCGELTVIASQTGKRAKRIASLNVGLRFGSVAIIIGGLALVAYVASIIEFKHSSDNLFGVLQGIEALINVLVLTGAAIFFLTTLEARWKRHQALGHLHELRTIIHVIDMHQLTKDPSTAYVTSRRTKSSPQRIMTPFELLRYLDYCSEMLSLTAKVATLYAQSTRDTLVIGAVTDIEQISANLSAKIWQKITIIQQQEKRNSKSQDAPDATDGPDKPE